MKLLIEYYPIMNEEPNIYEFVLYLDGDGTIKNKLGNFTDSNKYEVIDMLYDLLGSCKFDLNISFTGIVVNSNLNNADKLLYSLMGMHLTYIYVDYVEMLQCTVPNEKGETSSNELQNKQAAEFRNIFMNYDGESDVLVSSTSNVLMHAHFKEALGDKLSLILDTPLDITLTSLQMRILIE